MSPFLVAAAAGLALVVALALAWPALRQRRRAPRLGFDLEVYRDQLAEVERDRARGLIGAAEAEAARLEIERRILRAAATKPGETATASASGRALALAAAILVPLASGALYWAIGRPELPGSPLAARAQPPQNVPPEIAGMVARLEARLADDPHDGEGWLMLGRSKSVLNDPFGAADAYRNALKFLPDDPRGLGGLAESLIVLAGGMVTPEAEGLLQKLAQRDPADPRGGYYLGLAAAQAGDMTTAIQRWQQVLAASPADAPWRPRLEDSIREAARGAGVDAEATIAAAGSRAAPPAAAPPPPSEAAREIAELPPDERQARIRAMVDGLAARLEADGDDVEGWLRLARARTVLGEQAEALAAWDRAVALRPDDPEILKGKATAMLGPAQPPVGLPEVPEGAALLFEKVAAMSPDDPEPLWYLGVRALQEGDKAEARERWQHLLAMLDPAHPDYAPIKELTDRLAP
jgi:cytochrome c-type biogenesis protein CcmH